LSIALHYLSKTDIQVLYHIQNSAFNYGYIRITYNNPTSINIKEVAKTHRIYAIANIPLTPNETVNMKLMVIRNGPTKYTMQYHDVIRGVIIRSDNFHGYRHIDIELPQERLPPIPISELTECSSVVMGSPTFLLFLYSTSVQLVTLHNSQMVP
jgi:hypothetical protein